MLLMFFRRRSHILRLIRSHHSSFVLCMLCERLSMAQLAPKYSLVHRLVGLCWMNIVFIADSFAARIDCQMQQDVYDKYLGDALNMEG